MTNEALQKKSTLSWTSSFIWVVQTMKMTRIFR